MRGETPQGCLGKDFQEVLMDKREEKKFASDVFALALPDPCSAMIVLAPVEGVRCIGYKKKLRDNKIFL